MVTPTTRAHAILRGLGVPAPYPAASARILVAWQACEGGVAAQQGHNPMNTTLVVPHSTPLPGNTSGVQLYPTEAVGIAATVHVLLTAGYYGGLVAALRTGNIHAFLAHAGEIRTWGTDPTCIASRLGRTLPASTPAHSGTVTLGGVTLPLWVVGAAVGVPFVLALLRD